MVLKGVLVVVDAAVVGAQLQGARVGQPDGRAFDRRASGRVGRLRQGDALADERHGSEHLVREAAGRNAAVRDEASHARLESDKDRGQEGVRGGAGVFPGGDVAFGTQGCCVRGGQIGTLLGDVHPVSEERGRRKGGRGRGELGEDAADFAFAVHEDVVGPLEGDVVVKRGQAQAQRVAHAECAGVDEPPQGGGRQRGGNGDDRCGKERLAGGGNPGAPESAAPSALVVGDDRRQVRRGGGGIGEE